MSETPVSLVRKSSRKRNRGLFNGYWFTMDGLRIRRLTRKEIAEAYRLRAKHHDLIEEWPCESS